MRFVALFPLLCAIVAFILSLLCIFAGSKISFLENASILTLNTSMLGEFSVNTSSTSGGSSWLSSIEGDIQGDINGLINDVAKILDIHDFYSAHLLDYCEGYYTPSPISNATSQPSKNVTSCSNHTAFFTFDPTAILQSELKPGTNLSELKWPSAIKDAIVAVETASKVMFVLYFIGVGFAGLALIGAFIGFFVGGRFSAALNVMLDLMSFLSLGIASAIVTATSVKVVDAINQYGSDIGVAAYQGSTFLGMTWAATILMLVAAVGWLIDCCIGRKKTASKLG
ncbi:hypothetical protein MMC34_003685 [Xylographa carneopallida]|nr:hypothetical protein [Xylographa carneopallida]